MANFDLKFLDKKDNTKLGVNHHRLDNIISIYIERIGEETPEEDSLLCIHLDKSTAIKFAKTLRTEINKIKE